MLPTSPFPPLAVGFFGLGTGYLIYGTQELVGYPKRDEQVDLASGMWGIWMPGFLQFITGVYQTHYRGKNTLSGSCSDNNPSCRIDIQAIKARRMISHSMT